MTWREYVAGLRPDQRDKILYELLSFHLDELRDSDVAFTEGEDPEYQGTYTTNAEIYWTTSGTSLLDEETES